MSKSEVAPWRELPPGLADALEPCLPEITRETLAAIRREVPEYDRPLEGDFGDAVRMGVAAALRRFVDLIRDPDADDDGARATSVALGRAEVRAGRALDALQAAYRVGARVAWRHFAVAGHAAGVDAIVMARLAEAIFAFIDGLAADTVEGYAQAQSARAGEREMRRAELATTLLGYGTGADPVALAGRVGWLLPARAAAIACPLEHLAGLTRRLGPEVLAAPVRGEGCLIVPDAAGPGRLDALRSAGARRPAALGPEVALPELPHSWRLATAALALVGADDGLVVADEHLATLLLDAARPVVEEIARTRLAPLATLTPAARTRMVETALAFVQQAGNAAAMARALHLHPQTARYRIARLRELFGDTLDDPDARFEIEAALRSAHRPAMPREDRDRIARDGG